MHSRLVIEAHAYQRSIKKNPRAQGSGAEGGKRACLMNFFDFEEILQSSDQLMRTLIRTVNITPI